MDIGENYDLTHLNTFGVFARAKFFSEVRTEADIQTLLTISEFKENQRLILGGGSNILFTKDFDGIVVLNKLKGIQNIEENSDTVLIRAMSGEVWHDLVVFAVERGYWGLENLSLIPGTVGGAPMQNIGAYGGELKNIIENVEIIYFKTGEKRILTKEECNFGYRDSIFKKELKDACFIVAIMVRLSKTPQPNISYRVLADHLQKNNIESTNLKNISEAVSDIRRSKLPDPAEIGNAGSFFKNVFLEKDEAKKFLDAHPDAPTFEEDDFVKIPAGWLIEQCGLKGYRTGNVGVHEKQALVLVNYGGATGTEIKNLAEYVIHAVFKKFGLKLHPEVNFI